MRYWRQSRLFKLLAIVCWNAALQAIKPRNSGAVLFSARRIAVFFKDGFVSPFLWRPAWEIDLVQITHELLTLSSAINPRIRNE